MLLRARTRRTLACLALAASAAGLVGSPAGAAAPTLATPRATAGTGTPPPVSAAAIKSALIRHGEATVLVSMAPSFSAAGGSAQARARKYQVTHSYDQIGAFAVQVPANQLASSVHQLRTLPGVRSISVDQQRSPQFVPNDPGYGNETSYLDAVNAPAAWDVQTNSGPNGPTIAIIDTGVDVSHPDLAGKVVYTYNAVTGSADVTDAVGHGTFVAGVAAAITNNGVGVAGAGFGTRFMAIKVAAADGSIAVSDEINGIFAATAAGAKVINISLGGPTYLQPEADAVAYAQAHGVVVVAAAGNEGGTAPDYPAGYPGVIAVGATANGTRASFSEYGPWVTVAAPGIGFYSTAPTSIVNPSIYLWGSDTSYTGTCGGSTCAGTSFSTPLVSAEVALLAAQNPYATPAQLRAAVVNSAHGYTGLGLGAGQVDFAAALNHLPPTTSPILTEPGSAPVSGTVWLGGIDASPLVQFYVDFVPVGGPQPVIGNIVAVPWSSFGASNGVHTLLAVDCTAWAECAWGGSALQFTVLNGAPVITSPAWNQTVSGLFTVQTSSPGGGLAILVDGTPRAFTAGAPYSVSMTGTALSPGVHHLSAVECNSAGTACNGPASAAVRINNASLYPSLVTSPSHFSPNRDGVADTTAAIIHLPDTEAVSVTVRAGNGAVARGPLSLGAFGAGTHVWAWDGNGNRGNRVPDGTYAVVVSTARGTARGCAVALVTLDTTPPALSNLATSGSTFYPYPDGYLDTFGVGVHSNEGGVLRLTITTTSGGLVRSIAAAVPAGNVGLTWDGTDAAHHQVGPGAYHWQLSMTDAAGNTTATGVHGVVDSGGRLVTHTADVAAYGVSAVDSSVSSACATTSTATSIWAPTGIRLYNACPNSGGLDLAAATWAFALPAAVSYSAIELEIEGYTADDASAVRAVYVRSDGTIDVTDPVARQAGFTVNGFASVPLDGHVLPDGTVHAAVALTNEYSVPSDVDVHVAHLVVTYLTLG